MLPVESWLKLVVIALFLIGALFEFIGIGGGKIRLCESPSGRISGTIFALIGLLILLFG